MLSYSSGVGTRLKNELPGIILLHCLNRHLQLVLDGSVNDITQVNTFKTFMNKIYTTFLQSNRNKI